MHIEDRRPWPNVVPFDRSPGNIVTGSGVSFSLYTITTAEQPAG
jgi:hypothetical protein